MELTIYISIFANIDDQHLLTANTYVPLYSSKQILKQKLLLANKTKNFGLV